jgi:hypothetical protein
MIRKTAAALATLAALSLAGCTSPGTISGNEETPQSQTTIEGEPMGPPTSESESPDPEPGVAKFGQTVTFESGNKVQVSVRRVTGGILASVKITNGTKERLDPSWVTVDASYGKDGTQAECCLSSAYNGDNYPDESFTGSLLPGRSKTATFSFAVPRSGLSDIVIEVSGSEDVAIFEGKA